jgi:hypothetical protein
MRTFALPMLALLTIACDETRRVSPSDATAPDVKVVDVRRDFGTDGPEPQQPDAAAGDAAPDAGPTDAAGPCGDGAAMDC